jgi:putative colanic acid biosynthesis UDP-glucose lipid carrier transferase
MQYGRLSILQPLSVLIDLFCLNLAFVGAYFIIYHQIEGCFSPPYLVLFWVFNITWGLTLLVSRPFIEPRVTFNFYKLTYNFSLLLILHACLIAIFWVSIQAYYFSRLHLLFTYIILLFCGISVRALGVLLLKQLRTIGYNLRKYIIVGYGELSPSIVKFYHKHPEMGYQFFGYFDEKHNSDENNIKGDFQVLRKFIVENEIDYIYCCLPYIDNKKLQEIIDHSEQHRSQVKLLVDFTGFMKRGVSIEYHDHLPIINLSTKPFSDFRTTIVKRSFDITFSGIALIIGSPLLIILALITKLTSKGPIFYKSERIGLWGEKFHMFKFRSMHVNADEIADKLLNGDKHSIGEHDPRITNWGRFMRKTRLDELPQFFNVIKGDMSIVGPRPLPQYDVDMLMDNSPDNFQKILSIKPGITSMGQIKFGYASNTEENVERMNFDLLYLNKYSLRTDLWLIFQTAKIMIQGKGK